MYSSAYVWAKVLSHMEERLGSVTLSACFDDAEVVELNEDNLILYSPSDFRRDIIQRRYTGYIQDALKEIFNSDAKLLVFILKQLLILCCGADFFLSFSNGKTSRFPLENDFF